MGIVRRLAWSYSRGLQWRDCPRAVYIEHLSSGDPSLGMAKLLRRLRHGPAASAGIVVDELIRAHLHRVRVRRTPMPDMAASARQALLAQLRDSPARAEMLRGGIEPWEHEHVYQGDYYLRGHAPGEVERALQQAQAAAEGFLDSPLLASLARCAPEDVLLPQRGVPTFELHGVEVYASYDLIVRHKERALIVDWKSGTRTEGAESKARRQLGIYALYAIRALGYAPHNVHIQAAWLRESPKWEAEPVPSFLLELVESEIMEAAFEVKGRLTARMEADGRTVFHAEVDAFEARPQARRCVGCRFLEVCAVGRETLEIH